MTIAGSWAEAVALSSDDSDLDSKVEGVGSTERSNKSLVDKSTEDVNPEAHRTPCQKIHHSRPFSLSPHVSFGWAKISAPYAFALRRQTLPQSPLSRALHPLTFSNSHDKNPCEKISSFELIEIFPKCLYFPCNSSPLQISSSMLSASSRRFSIGYALAPKKYQSFIQPSSFFATNGRMVQAAVIKRVEMYQEYMKHIPIPTNHGSVIPFTTWQGLAKSLKKLYGQPLHYLTITTLKQWDELRIGTDDEHLPLDTIIHPCKAEATSWLMEEVHRLTSSHHHLVELWASDPMLVDPVMKKK